MIISGNFSRLSDAIFKTIIDKSDVLESMAKAYRGEEQKNIARDELYKELLHEYGHFKEFGVRQLHFHLKNSESFLRFHHHERFGDGLNGIREVVGWVNANQMKMEGFEQGKYYDGFRYVFPLIRENGTKKEHLGSVELSFSSYSFIEDFINSYNIKAQFLLVASIVEEKILSSEKSNYEKSQFNGLLYEKNIKKELKNALREIDIERIKKSDIERVGREIYRGEIFSVPSKDEHAVFTFIPIKNPISKKVASVIILQEESDEFENFNNQFLMFLFSGGGVILFAFLYIYKEFSSRVKYEEASKKTQKILDTQEAIIVILNEEEMVDTNKKFLDFFGFDKLEDFKAQNSCICDYFEKDDRFFHIGKILNEVFWVKALLELKDKEHIVSMRDKNGKLHSFAVLINGFEDCYILSFSDISDTMSEHFSLEQKATHDNLTNAYNREYFYENIDSLIDEGCKKELKIGIVMFDIDHFKAVNDTYGHNVGDLVLKRLVKTVHNTIRSDDLLVRWGGEEFLLIMKTNTAESLVKISQNIRAAIEREKLENVKNVTCSFGVTIYAGNEDIQESIKRADKGLYEAKESGRNRVVVKFI